MAINSTQLKGIKVDHNKDIIIGMYNREVDVRIIATKYDVGIDTICRRLRSWGVKVRKGDYHKSKTTRKHWYRKFSKSFIENRVALTKRYGDKIEYPRGVGGPGYRKLIRSIT